MKRFELAGHVASLLYRNIWKSQKKKQIEKRYNNIIENINCKIFKLSFNINIPNIKVTTVFPFRIGEIYVAISMFDICNI